jgi:hypothetical protein
MNMNNNTQRVSLLITPSSFTDAKHVMSMIMQLGDRLAALGDNCVGVDK